MDAMDLLSVTGSVIGVIGLATSVSYDLYKLCKQLASAPNEFENLVEELRYLEEALSAIKRHTLTHEPYNSYPDLESVNELDELDRRHVWNIDDVAFNAEVQRWRDKIKIVLTKLDTLWNKRLTIQEVTMSWENTMRMDNRILEDMLKMVPNPLDDSQLFTVEDRSRLIRGRNLQHDVSCGEMVDLAKRLDILASVHRVGRSLKRLIERSRSQIDASKIATSNSYTEGAVFKHFEEDQAVLDRLEKEITNQPFLRPYEQPFQTSQRYQIASGTCLKGGHCRELTSLDVTCLILGKTVGPPLQWTLLLSLHPRPFSLLDRKVLYTMPFLANAIAAISSHHTVTVLSLLLSATLSVAAIFRVVAKVKESARSSVFLYCWLAIALGGLFWTYAGGSSAGYFVVLMPFLLNVGISLGLLSQSDWACRFGRQKNVCLKQYPACNDEKIKISQ